MHKAEKSLEPSSKYELSHRDKRAGRFCLNEMNWTQDAALKTWGDKETGSRVTIDQLEQKRKPKFQDAKSRANKLTDSRESRRMGALVRGYQVDVWPLIYGHRSAEQVALNWSHRDHKMRPNGSGNGK